MACKKSLESCDGHLGVHQLADQLGQLEQRHPQDLHRTDSVTDMAGHRADDGMQKHVLLEASGSL